MNRRYKIWRWVRDYAEKQMFENYLKPHGGFNHACPNCERWESDGNIIYTDDTEDYLSLRSCKTCKHQWRAFFSPFGFVSVDDPVSDRGSDT